MALRSAAERATGAGTVGQMVLLAGERIEAVRPEDLVTIVYTSGTTGPPKGCALSHANFIAASTMSRAMLQLNDIQRVVYQFLPLAHVFARVIQTVVLDVGGTLVFWSGDSKRIVAELAEVQPTHLPAVPRIYEKVHTAVMSNVQSQSRARRAVFRWALAEGSRARRRLRAGGRPGLLAAARHRSPTGWCFRRCAARSARG